MFRWLKGSLILQKRWLPTNFTKIYLTKVAKCYLVSVDDSLASLDENLIMQASLVCYVGDISCVMLQLSGVTRVQSLVWLLFRATKLECGFALTVHSCRLKMCL